MKIIQKNEKKKTFYIHLFGIEIPFMIYINIFSMGFFFITAFYMGTLAYEENMKITLFATKYDCDLYLDEDEFYNQKIKWDCKLWNGTTTMDELEDLIYERFYNDTN